MSISFTERYTQPIPHKLWCQDYAPTQLSEIIGNETVVETLQSFIRSDHIPNIILYGPNGCGKTKMAQIVVRQYLGKYYDRCNLEIIGSIYRGKNVVSEKNDKKKTSFSDLDNPNIINFIKKNMRLPEGKCRVVTIYDIDCMTNEAQMALRRIIEIYATRTRFIFVCNNLNHVIEALQSRALVLKCQSLTSDEIMRRLRSISDLRRLNINDTILEAISIMANGDLKQAINCLQLISPNSNCNLDQFYHLFNIPSIKSITQFVTCCLNKDGMSALTILDQLLDSGYNVTDILDILIKVLIHDKELNPENRAFLVNETIKTVLMNEQVSSNLLLYKLAFTIVNK